MRVSVTVLLLYLLSQGLLNVSLIWLPHKPRVNGTRRSGYDVKLLGHSLKTERVKYFPEKTRLDSSGTYSLGLPLATTM
jgi:hypothetical protein